MISRFPLFALLLILCIYIQMNNAAIPQHIAYQGVLTDTIGNPRPDGTYSFAFSLYDASTGGTALWNENKSMYVKKGMFSTFLGNITPFGSTLTFDKPYWLGIAINGADELTPRIALSTSAYSFRALRADTAEYTKKALYADTADYAKVGEASGKAGGDLTGAYPSPSIATNAITSSKIADSTITDSDISDTAFISGRKINPDFGNNNIATMGRLSLGTTTQVAPLTILKQEVDTHRVISIGGLDGRWLTFNTSALAGAYNPIAQAGDNQIICGSDKESPGLVIGPMTPYYGRGIRIDTLGRVGIGTGTPRALLDIDGPVCITNNANIGGANLSGFLGNGGMLAWNRSGGLGEIDIISFSGGGSDGGFSFYDIPDENTADNLLFRIDKNGNVGIGTQSPVFKLEVIGTREIANFIGNDPDVYIRLTNNAPNAHSWQIGVLKGSADGDGFQIRDVTSSATRFKINENGNVGIGETNPQYTLQVNGTAWCSSGSWSGSDKRWKRNITPLDESLTKVTKLQGVSYEWQDKKYASLKFPTGKQIGLVAQDVERVLPELVHTDSKGYKSLSYDKLTAVLVEAIKEQQKQIESYKEQLERQQKQIDKLASFIGMEE